MPRVLAVVCLFLAWRCAVAQSTASSDPFAISLAQNSVTALTGGVRIGDVTLNANVIWIFGPDNETGTGTFQAKGMNESRVDLKLSSESRSDVRNATNGIPGGSWETNGGVPGQYALHNCWTDAGWFFPELSSLTQTSNPNFVFSYIGQEKHGGANTQHIRVYQLGPFQEVSAMDFFLDAVSFLPVAVASNAHPDKDMGTNIPTEILFANYQRVNGLQVPFHFQKMFNGSVVLDATVTSSVFNSGLADSLFTLQ